MFTFRPIDISDKQRIDDFTCHYLPFSDFNFTSIFCNDIAHDVLIHIDSSVFIIKLRDYVTDVPAYSFIGSITPEQVKNLYSLAKKSNITTMFPLIPKFTAQDISSFAIGLSEDRDSWDYIHSLDEFVHLEGKKFEHKRWRINQFKRYYPHIIVHYSKCREKDEQAQIKTLFKKWSYGKAKEDYEHEGAAIERLLQYSKQLNVDCVSLYDSDKLIGFATSEILTNKYCIAHFLKADKDYKGVFEYLYYQSAIFNRNRGCTYINLEQDLGIAGLRESKLSWNPVSFLEKYTVTFRQ